MEGRLPTDIPQEFVHGPMLINISGNSASCFLFVLHPRRSLWRFGLVAFSGTWFLFSPLFICAPTSTTLSLGMYLASMLHLLSTFVILSFVSNLHIRTRTSWKFPFTSSLSFLLLLLRTRLTSSCLTHTHPSTRSPQSRNILICSYNRPTGQSFRCGVRDLRVRVLFYQ